MSEYILLLCSACVSLVANLFGRLRQPRTPRTLVVKLDHVGDVILATPAIRAIRDARPQEPIDVLIGRGSSVALDGNPSIDRILHYDSHRYRRQRRAPGERGALRVVRDVARERYSTIVELRGDWWTLLLPFLTGATRRVDRGSVRVREWVAHRGRAGRMRPILHEVETNLEVVRPLLGHRVPEQLALQIFPPDSARQSMVRRLQTIGVDLESPIVCIHSGAAWRPRAWRPERFAAVADWIQDHYHAQVLFVGSSEERDIEATVRTNAKGGRAFWLAGELTWQELTALLERARLLIGNDSGPAHVAAALGIPSVVLFGPQEPERFRPWSDRSVVLHHRVHCCPCWQDVCVHPENPCVNLIELEEVKAQVRRILGPPESLR